MDEMWQRIYQAIDNKKIITIEFGFEHEIMNVCPIAVGLSGGNDMMLVVKHDGKNNTINEKMVFTILNSHFIILLGEIDRHFVFDASTDFLKIYFENVHYPIQPRPMEDWE
ncbi:MAG: hypothetical protein ABI763_00400 [Bacteroidota bacterium]